MRQVPAYLIIGNGRVSRHMQHYFSLSKISFTVWSRQDSISDLQQKIQHAERILILIRDNAIDEFIQSYLLTSNALRIHFSGSLVTSYAYGAHPLMTFADHFYDIDTYKQIPFIVDSDAPSFTTLLPGLINPHATLNANLKAKYHALCVLSGNFSCLLWQAFFEKIQHELKLPLEFAQHYLTQQNQNILHDYQNALTGPLSRHDHVTIQKNLQALQGSPLHDLYQSFVDYYGRKKI